MKAILLNLISMPKGMILYAIMYINSVTAVK